MDYKVTFTDGSEALMHHGIKGMKWGVWNAETAARYNGSHYYSPTQREVDRATNRRNKAAANLDGTSKKLRKYEKADKHYWRTVSGKNAAIKSNMALAAGVVSGMLTIGAAAAGVSRLVNIHEMVDPEYVHAVAEKFKWPEDSVRKTVITMAKHDIDSASRDLGFGLVNGVITGIAAKTSAKYEGRNKAHKTVEKPKKEPKDNPLKWSPEKKKALDEAAEKAENAWNYKEWNGNFDPGYSKATADKLQKEADEATEKFRKLK